MAGFGRTLFLLGTVLASTWGSIFRTYPSGKHPYQVIFEKGHYNHFNSLTSSPLRGDIPEEPAFLTFTYNNAKINKEAPLLSYHYTHPLEVPIRPLPEITIRAKPTLPATKIDLHEHNGLPCFNGPAPAYTPVELPKAPELPAFSLPGAPAPILVQPAHPKVWEPLPEAPKLPPFTVPDVPKIETPAAEIIQPAPVAPEPVEVLQLSPVLEAPHLPPLLISEILYEAPNIDKIDPCITRIYPASHFPCITEERPQYQPLPVFQPEPELAAPLAPIPAAPELPPLSIPEIQQEIIYAEPAEPPKEFAPLPCFDTVAEPLPAVAFAPELPPLSLPEAPAQIYIEKVDPETAPIPLAPIPTPPELSPLALPKPQEIKTEETFVPAAVPCFDKIEEPAQYIEEVFPKPLPPIPAPPVLPPLVLPEPQEIKIEEAAAPCFEEIVYEPASKPLPSIPALPALPPLVLPEPEEIKIEEAAAPCFEDFVYEPVSKPLPSIPAFPALPPLVLPEPEEIKIEEAAAPCFEDFIYEPVSKPLPSIPAPPALPPLALPEPQVEETLVPAAAPCFDKIEEPAYIYMEEVAEPAPKPLPPIPAPPTLPPLTLPSPPEPIYVEEPKAPIVVEELPVHITSPCEGKSISELPSFQAPYFQYFPAEAEAYGFPVITK